MSISFKRDKKIDILRAIAIICIILAHSAPNQFVFQIRNFDVTLMVLLIGVSFYLSNMNKNLLYSNYLRKRFRRLIVPTWVFLTVFFIIFYFISLVLGQAYYFDLEQIINSYSTVSGIGYVWIMWIFFVVAIICPLYLKLSNKIENNHVYILLLVLFYVVYYLLSLLHGNMEGNAQKYYEHYILQGIGYSIIAGFGIRLKLLSRKEIVTYCIIFLMVFLGLMLINDFSPTQAFKYPPTLYYFSYGLFVSLLLYRILDSRPFNIVLKNRFLMFVSQNSLWLYFWHLIPFYLIKLFGNNFELVNTNFITRFIFLFIIALLTTYIQVLWKSKLNKWINV